MSKEQEKHNQVLTINLLEAQEHINKQAKLIEHLSSIQLAQQNNINVLREDTTHLTQAIREMIRGDLRVNCQCMNHQHNSPHNNIPTALEVV